MRIGVLTSGGDCPGLNAVIRSVVHRATADHGDEVIGFRDGWKGLLECDYRKLDLDAVNGILARGGTILGSSRVQPAHLRDGVERARGHVADLGLDAIIPIGGEGTLKAARLLSDAGLPIVGVPKTIDNDIAATDVTFGFDTAVGVATDALDRLKTTAESHQRVLIVEVMGRHTGWIALHSGMAAGAHAIVVPERPFDVAELTRKVGERFEAGKKFAIVVVAEGAKPREGSMAFDEGGTDIYGHERFAGVARQLSLELERRLGKEARAVILGHVQRGGTPTAYDRVLATRFGWHAVEAAHDGAFGMMTALRGTDITLVPLAEAVESLKTVPGERYAEVDCVL
ncbi:MULTISPECIES: 6-phosphofructokinase [Streptomyces]|uniref:ATP-dependent 6-phosphofructokinase n=2 Tax=Streptomyces rimosus subsp. rimosus TaxID=132474 RepID=L8EIR1_STRR1|nr:MULTISPECIES: 6-phosphofructokinase [Streptomyces]KOG80003.1 6-phosphofructokinase [Kitasatospora aureofaciens]MYT41262.1 ATP-dependent 6-phosphofructokinase [Streptomyces sp. SID5471]KEF08259.1 6-phosphofructokinase [Streptomyces rimosus]KOT31048.1 6-phosphofructokinase [Streptomyces rimosus subsp. rimosus]KOT31098.1 6-phosphofructokinase [Streptomyces sp. NRRL WC-3701]